MEIQDIDNQIIIKQTQVRVEKDPHKKEKLNTQLRRLRLEKEIELIRMKIAQLQ